MTTKDQIRLAALEEFGRFGFHGASLQHIGERAGTSKASVLYHFPSKEALLEASLAPALDAIRGIAEACATPPADADARRAVFEQFIAALVDHRQALRIFITQRGALTDSPVIERGNAMIDQIAAACAERDASHAAITRMGVGLSGVAFLLSTSDEHAPPVPEAELPGLLVDTLMRLSEED